MDAIPQAQAQRFYRAALLVLRLLDHQQGTPSRFGSAADIRWDSFRGDLDARDRVDLLCRDAAVRWGAAFSPTLVFELSGLTDDEPFGPDWSGLAEARDAERLWKEAAAFEPSSMTAALEELAAALDVGVAELCGDPEAITPSSRVLLAGGHAIHRAAALFASREDLRWAEQVVAVADRPEERQLAGLVALALQATHPTRLVAPRDVGDLAGYDAVLLSSDASAGLWDLVGKALA